MIRSCRLATVRPTIARPRKIETPSGATVPIGLGEPGQRQAEQQAQQQAQEQPDDRRHELGGRQLLDRTQRGQRRDDRQVRQQREAEHDPGDDPADTSSVEPGAGWNTASWAMTSVIPIEPAECGSQEMDGSDHAGLDWPRSRRTGPIAGRRRSPLVERGPQPSTRVSASTVTVRRRIRAATSARSPGPARPRAATSHGGVAERVAQVRHGHDLDARRRSARPAGRPGTIARSNPSRAASRRRRSRPDTGRSSPSRPTSPTATVRGSIGRSRSDDASASATARSRPGSATREAAGEIRVDVVAPEADAGAPAEDGEQQRQSGRVDARRAAGRRRVAGRRDERLDLDRAAAGCPPASRRRRCPGRRRRARRGTPGRDRRPRAARTRPSRARPARPSSRTGSWRRARGASRRRARPRGR